MQQLLQKEVFVNSYPEQGTVVKKTKGEKIRFMCRVAPEFLEKDMIVEMWSDIKGRHHGFRMKRKPKTNIYYVDIELNNTGLFSVSFRCMHKEQKYWHWINSPAEVHVDPDYINKSIVYNAFIRFFGQKKITSKGRIKYGDSGTFDDLKKHVNELKNMGVDIIYLNPIHVIGELYRNYNPHDHLPAYLQPGCPYSIKDYKSVDPELGIDRDHGQGPHSTLSDPMLEFKEFVNEAHKNKMKVYMDLVFNHTSHDFVLQRLHPEWFLYKENIKSIEEHYIYPEEVKQGKPWGDQKHTFCPYDHGYWWEDAAQLNWEHMIPEGKNKPPKNPTLDEMYEYFKSIPKYWIKHLGIDGFRCDVAYRVPVKFWRECIHEAREFAKKEYPKNGSLTGDVVFIAESYVDNLKELYEAGFTATYGDFSNKLYNPLSLKGYVDYMYNISGKFFPENAKFFIFPECHDFHRNTKKLLGQLGRNSQLSERANMSRWVLTAMLPGIPMIFNGFEKLEWQPINLFSYSSINWEEDNVLKEYITKINKIRNKHEALQKGSYEYIDTSQGLNDGTQLFCFARILGKENFIVCVNMDIHNKAGHITLRLPSSLGLESKKYKLKDLLTNVEYSRKGNEIIVILEPGQSHIFKVEK